MIRKATIVACTVVAAGMAALGIIQPETPYDLNAVSPNYKVWLSEGFLFVTIQRDLRPTGWTGYVEHREGAFPGVVYGRIHAIGGQRTLILGVAGWLLAVLFGVYPALVLVRDRVLILRRRRDGLCVKCGYDLTGNVSGRCSECGVGVERVR